MKSVFVTLVMSFMALTAEAKTYSCHNYQKGVEVAIQITSPDKAEVTLKSSAQVKKNCDVAEYQNSQTGKVILAFLCDSNQGQLPELLFMDPVTLAGRIEFAKVHADVTCR